MCENPTVEDATGEPDGNSDATMPLMVAAEGQEVELTSVRAGRHLHHRLAEMGLRPGVRFRVIATGRPGPFIICVKDCRFVLGREMVHRIMVRPVCDKS